MNKINNSVDFDDYVDNYESLLKEQLSFFSKDRGYFSEYKVNLTKKYTNIEPKTVLDFGCGIGLSLAFLHKYFPNANLFATDISKKSVEYVRNNFSYVNVLDYNQIGSQKFDLIFITGVFHHVPIEQRDSLMQHLSTLLANDGQLFIFEHNPYNPVTRRMVATCPFDEDAVLLSLNSLKKIIAQTNRFKIEKTKYCLFFPEILSKFRFLESKISWLPLGGQYFVKASIKV